MIYIYTSSRIFEHIPQNGPQYSHRKNIWGLAILVGLIVMLMGWEGAFMSIRGGGGGGRVMQKRGTVR